MIWIENAYATVFEAKTNERGYFQGRCSTSEKIERNGDTEYRNSYWSLRATKNTQEALLHLMDPSKGNDRGVRIKITKGKVDNVSFKDKEGNNKSYPTITVLAFETLNGSGSARASGGVRTAQQPAKQQPVSAIASQLGEDGAEEDLPF